MAKIFDDSIQAIGRTPLVRLHGMAGSKATVLAKIEGRNPAYSVKDRVGAAMLEDAVQRSALRPGMTIVEPTSGNTGIGLAFAAAVLGYKCLLTMPETMSIERRRVLRMLGADVLLTPGSEGMAGAIRHAEELVARAPDMYYMPQQFKNPANPAIHEATTGPELWNDTDGRVDVLVAGVGTGGTLTGIARYFKWTQHVPIVTVAVEPAASAVLTQHLAGQPLCPGPHKIQGIGPGFIPETLDISLVDRVETVTDDEAMDFARRLAREEGILAGISSGAAVAVACRLAALSEMAGKVIAVILPDAGERYVSSELFAKLGECRWYWQQAASASTDSAGGQSHD
ncbi:MAG: cysteine synthase A [Desulfovibrio sp.]|nr:cysteine synthase A [Desulfovibrio sp.]